MQEWLLQSNSCPSHVRKSFQILHILFPPCYYAKWHGRMKSRSRGKIRRNTQYHNLHDRAKIKPFFFSCFLFSSTDATSRSNGQVSVDGRWSCNLRTAQTGVKQSSTKTRRGPWICLEPTATQNHRGCHFLWRRKGLFLNAKGELAFNDPCVSHCMSSTVGGVNARIIGPSAYAHYKHLSFGERKKPSLIYSCHSLSRHRVVAEIFLLFRFRFSFLIRDHAMGIKNAKRKWTLKMEQEVRHHLLLLFSPFQIRPSFREGREKRLTR